MVGSPVAHRRRKTPSAEPDNPLHIVVGDIAAAVAAGGSDVWTEYRAPFLGTPRWHPVAFSSTVRARLEPWVGVQPATTFRFGGPDPIRRPSATSIPVIAVHFIRVRGQGYHSSSEPSSRSPIQTGILPLAKKIVGAADWNRINAPARSFGSPHLPELGADLVAALAGLEVNDLSHGCDGVGLLIGFDTIK